MNFTRRYLLAAGGLVPLLAPDPAWPQAPAAPKRPSIGELLHDPSYVDCTISPDGKTVAVLQHVSSIRKMDGVEFTATRGQITFRPFDNLKEARVINLDVAPSSIAWLSNSRLGFEFPFTNSLGAYTSRARNLAILDYATGAHEFLTNTRDGKKRSYQFEGLLARAEGADEKAVVQLRDGPAGALNVYEFDMDQGALRLIERGQLDTRNWIVQDRIPVIRMDVGRGRLVMNLYARSSTAKTWTLIRQIHRNSLISSDFDIVGVAEEPGVLLVAALAESDNFRAIHRFDLKTMAWAGTLARQEGWDLEGVCQSKGGRYIGATFTKDRSSYIFKDPSLGEHLAKLEETAAAGCNVFLTDASDDLTRFVAHVEGPREPGAWILFDRRRAGFSHLGDARPWVSPQALTATTPLTITARDGVEFRAYLTAPAGKGPRPLIVLPHGGPEVRDSLQFDPAVQALAGEGWAVLQPNFRGSGGYGRAFAEAGHGSWNGRVMEDIEDATNQVIKSGQADPRFVAIMGASFGGYAALMGAVRQPDFYRGIICTCGVSDPAEMLRIYAADGEDSPAYRYWLKRIGNPKNTEAMAAIAPIRQVATIKAPVLLFHGAGDDIVPVDQARRMEAALKAAGKHCEYIEMPYVGHTGWPNNIKGAYLGRSIGFLHECFGSKA